MGAENLNPLDELKNLDQQVETVTDLAALKPIFYRLDEIAKDHSDDFEVQLVVGDIKQHLVNRGTRLKADAQASPPAPLPGGPQAPTVKLNRPMPPPIPPGPPQPPTVKVNPQTPLPLPDEDLSPPTVKMNPPPRPPAPPDLPPAPVKAPPAMPPPMPFAAPPKGPEPPRRPEPPRIPDQPASPFDDGPARLLSSAKFGTPAPRVGPPPLGPLPSAPRTPPPAPSGPLFPGPAAPRDPFATGQQPPVLAAPPPLGPPAMPPQGPPAAPPKKASPPGPPVNWKRPLALGAILGALVSIALIVVLVNQARKRNASKTPAAVATVQVDVTTIPPNAAVKINGDTKCNAPCKVDLAPGDYQVMAFLDGYDPATNALNVVAGQPGSVNLTLTAQPQTVRIFTDLDPGKIVVDDQPPADLQGGQFALENIMPGPHTVKITGRNAEATFSFQVTEAKPPALTGPVTTRNLSAVVVSSLGNQARVVTSSGPLKLAVNGQPEEDASPTGVDLKSFIAGSDEIAVGDGKDQRSMKETFGPAPMLTAWFKSDLNLGTLIVTTGEDDAHVFLNGKEINRRTQKGQLRVQTIGSVSVRVVKDGFQNEPAQTADVKKGAEVRLNFKMKPLPKTTQLQIRGGTPGAEVLLDQTSIGTIGADGSFTYANVAPGDHTIDLRREQFTPKRLQRNFKMGQPLTLNGAEVTLAAAAAANGTIRLARTPPDAAVSYRRSDENQSHEARGNQLDLPPGTYVFSAKAPGYADKSERVQIASGENRTVEMALSRAPTLPPPPKPGGITDFEDPAAWKKDGELWVHKGGGWIPYKLGPKGTYTFTVELLKGGNVFKGGRIRWCVQYLDPKNYLLYELDKKNFWAEVVQNGKKLERVKTQHDLEKQKAFTIQIEITADHVVHKIQSGGQWTLLDSFAEPGRNFANGKFGFLIQGNDEIGISDFSFVPGK